jgi:hypothetical protein
MRRVGRAPGEFRSSRRGAKIGRLEMPSNNASSHNCKLVGITRMCRSLTTGLWIAALNGIDFVVVFGPMGHKVCPCGLAPPVTFQATGLPPPRKAAWRRAHEGGPEETVDPRHAFWGTLGRARIAQIVVGLLLIAGARPRPWGAMTTPTAPTESSPGTDARRPGSVQTHKSEAEGRRLKRSYMNDYS